MISIFQDSRFATQLFERSTALALEGSELKTQSLKIRLERHRKLFCGCRLLLLVAGESCNLWLKLCLK